MNRKLFLSIAVAAFAIAGTVIARWEGTRYEAYLDTGGVWTICTGRTKNVHKGMTATAEQCKAWLAEDMALAEAAVNECVRVPVGVYRRSSLISFSYNVGREQFCRSTLVKKLNQGDYAGSCLELKRWVYDNGVYIRGLAHRRDDEYRLCTKIDFSLVYSGVTFTQH